MQMQKYIHIERRVLPFDAASEHYSHGCEELQHYHVGHIIAGLLSADSKYRREIHHQDEAELSSASLTT